MMNDTKEIKEYLERKIIDTLKESLNEIKSEGFTRDTYTTLRMLQDDLSELNAVNHFFNSWHQDARKEQIKK